MSSVTDEIKARVDLVDLVGRAVPLRKSGSNSFKGLCPFHQEKTPSFYVFPDNGTWICFGCQKKGSAFDWVMEREHLEFGEALRMLAQATGVELPSHRDPDEQERTARLYDLLGRAQAYYQGLLQGAAGAGARRYLAERGVNEESIATFGLGYAPGGNGLLRYLHEHGFSDEEMIAAGVVSVAENDGRTFDFFRDRVLFAIRDLQGRTVAFGGRTIGEGTPKYLNSRDSLLFHKQETLFALDLARKAIAQTRRAVIVEGYLDALIAHQYGHKNVVATLGTAVTERHLRLLRRSADEIVLALDSDAAGQAATWRTLQVAEQSLVVGAKPVLGPNRRRVSYVPDRAAQLKVLTIPEAKDPDELIRAEPGAWPVLVQEARPVTEFVLSQLPSRHELSTARGKAEAADEAAEILAGVSNPVEQAYYVQRVAEMLNVDEAAVRQTVRRKQPRQTGVRPAAEQQRQDDTGGTSATNGRPLPEQVDDGDPLDDYVLALLLRLRHLTTSLPPEAPRDDEYALSESRALAAHIASGAVTAESTASPPGLDSTLARAQRLAADVERFDGEELLRELGVRRLEMRKRALLVRKRHLHDLLRGASEEDDRGRWAAELSQLARSVDEIDQELAAGQPLLAGAG